MLRNRSKGRTPPQCTCGDRGTCNYCPSIAVIATAQAHLPAGGPGQQAADRIARRR